MKEMDIKFVKKHEEAILPKRNNTCPLTGDVGYDLFSVADIIIPPGEFKVVPVGLLLGDITPGYWFRIEARSGLGFKHNLQPHFGIIDNPYRGDLGIKIYNLGPIAKRIKKGQACAQFVVYEMINANCGWIDSPTETTRGENGFGSSDKV